MVPDTDTLISAGLQVIVFFCLMRLSYGAWPWEYRKTWYATKPQRNPYAPPPGSLNQGVAPIMKWVEPEGPVALPRLELVADDGTDSFNREELKDETIPSPDGGSEAPNGKPDRGPAT
jgi:hypothetical protein